MAYAAFDKDGFLIAMAHYAQPSDPNYIEIEGDPDANSIFCSAGKVIVRSDATFACPRTVIASDVADSVTVTGLPSGGWLLVNGEKIKYDTATSYTIKNTDFPNADLHIELTGPFKSAMALVRSNTEANLLNDVRTQRDALLTATDWTQMPDAALTDDQKAAYTVYRTTLRDITTAQPTCNIDTVVWPVKP